MAIPRELAWKIYLSGEDPEAWTEKAKVASDYLKQQHAAERQGAPLDRAAALYKKRYFDLDVKSLMARSEVVERWPDFSRDLEEQCEAVLGLFAHEEHMLALADIDEHQHTTHSLALADFSSASLFRIVAHYPDFPLIRARPICTDEILNIAPVRCMKTDKVGRFVQLSGTVIRVTGRRPMCIMMAFECVECGAIEAVHQPYGKFAQPMSCVTCTVTSSKKRKSSKSAFSPLLNHKWTITVEWETMCMQEAAGNESGGVPRTIDVELSRDLCGSVAPGDVLNVTGVVRLHSASESMFASKNDPMSVAYIHALSISKRSHQSDSFSEFSHVDLMLVQEIHALGSDIFKLLVNSLCPSIHGHENVKAGLLLALFGGSKPDPKATLHVRSDVHVLVMGDPGMGKSQLLGACSKAAPRSTSVTGVTSTSCGLTATLTRGSDGEFQLDAGALVISNQGCCIIDEMDKMSAQHHQAMLEVMEQQEACIAKGGITCRLPAQTSVIAAANPTAGHYDRSKTLLQNIKLGQPLLSRFDLIFLVLDVPDEERDEATSRHILSLHGGRRHQVNSRGFSSQLAKQPGEEIRPVDPNLLKTYIAYARRHVNPKLNAEAKEALKEFYSELREQRQPGQSLPVTVRQLESLIRLTEAKAKVDLREEATVDDANAVIDIYCEAVAQTNITAKTTYKGGTLGRGGVAQFLKAIREAARKKDNGNFSKHELFEVYSTSGSYKLEFVDLIERLNLQGFIIMKSSKCYRLIDS